MTIIPFTFFAVFFTASAFAALPPTDPRLYLESFSTTADAVTPAMVSAARTVLSLNEGDTLDSGLVLRRGFGSELLEIPVQVACDHLQQRQPPTIYMRAGTVLHMNGGSVLIACVATVATEQRLHLFEGQTLVTPFQVEAACDLGRADSPLCIMPLILQCKTNRRPQEDSSIHSTSRIVRVNLENRPVDISLIGGGRMRATCSP